ncbi:thioredoxin domain-containing protein [Mycolicibacillus trivialis]|uniref:Thioredoxin-like fold domain-containing protein n=1 Tax=Mycolicibacillus trivialis TaxID=1798 RepID=A0A1X2EM78_9MYCO|nr:thioredoxin domain-containing protein [Mycolicibacillus trivialis]ORX06128.1 hypothetical protein AWC30_06890 [Mycolicibacillus trivialis]
MRYLWAAVVVALGCLVTGPAHADVAPATTVAADGFSVLLGSPDAPVQLEIFCEPQCPVCAQFEDASGGALAHRIGNGELAVTYRWLTFLDQKRGTDKSDRIANALILAADPATPPVAYQGFVNEIYRQQDAHSPSPSAAELATMAARSGVGGMAIARIAIDLPAVDTAAMSSANMDRLKQVNPDNPGTPTVYDLGSHTVVDVQDGGWLDALFAS